jgi:hypothetical protein
MRPTSAWINSYNSLMKLSQDPTTGMLIGTYASTTGGTGTYDVVGWTSLPSATPNAGQTMALSILWRSNDGGKSDPSHEVSGMAGQVVSLPAEENLELIHIFVETNPNTTPQMGFYPDKLTFTPYTTMEDIGSSGVEDVVHTPSISIADSITGHWAGNTADGLIAFDFQLPNPSKDQLVGSIIYPNGNKFPIVGFVDIYCTQPPFTRQGITFSSYVDGLEGRVCIAMAGYLDLQTNQIHLMPLSAQTTNLGSTWYQTQLSQLILSKSA